MTDMKKKNENDFDRILREKLNAPIPPPIGDSWDLLEHKIADAELGSPAAPDPSVLDEIVFSKLHAYHAPFQPEHWKQLAQRLQAEETMVQRIYSYKAMEALLLLLLIWFGGQTLYPYKPGPVQKAPATATPQAALEQTAPAILHNQNLSVDASNPAAEDLGYPLNIQGAPAEFPLPASAPKGSAPTAGQQAAKPAASPLAPLANALETTALQQQSVEPFQPGEKLLDPGLVSSASVPAAQAVPFREPASVESAGQADPGLVQPDFKPGKKRILRVAMFGGPEYIRVITPPFMANRELISGKQYALGYSGGLSISVLSGKWEWETGLVYMAKSYSPPPVVYINGGNVVDGYDGEGITQIELNMMRAPVNVRRSLFQLGEWRSYAQAGLSLNIISQANYYKGTQEEFTSDSYRPAPPPAGAGRNNDTRQLKELPKGWLEGGTFNENAYLTAGFAVGLERDVFDRWSVFGQPTYQHMLFKFDNKGIAPFNDRLHTLSWLFGVRVKL